MIGPAGFMAAPKLESGTDAKRRVELLVGLPSFDWGLDAYQAGLRFGQCPHQRGSDDAAAWELGWREGEREDLPRAQR